MHRRWVAGLIVVTGCMAAILGCSDGGEVRAGPGEEHPDGAVLQPGDVIADGFVVAESTTVPGGAFPALGSTYDGVEAPRTWSAVVETDLELPEVVGAYAQQASDLGFSLGAQGYGTTADAAADSACSANVVQQVDVMEGAEGQPPAGTPLSIACSVTGERVRGDQLETFEVYAIRSYSTHWSGPSNSFTIGLTLWPPNRGTAEMFPVEPVASSGPTTSFPAAPAVSTLPAAREGSTVLACNDHITLEPESRLLGAAFDCSWPYSTLVLEVTGDPDKVFNAYSRQITSARGFNPPVTDEAADTFDGRSVRTAQVFGDDSSYLRITMLSGGNSPTVMSIQDVSG